MLLSSDKKLNREDIQTWAAAATLSCSLMPTGTIDLIFRYTFNSAQRAHQNFVEAIASTLLVVVFAGLYYPVPAACLGLAIIIGRLVYAIGYASKGPQGRVVGVILSNIGFLGCFGLSITSAVNMIQGYSPASFE